MVKPLTFKGDKKPKKRKRTAAAAAEADNVNVNEIIVNDDDSGSIDDAPRSSKLARREAAAAAAAGDQPPDDDSWVSADGAGDVVGPVMIVLPTDVPAALACDVSGKVFALEVENIVDGNPASAEPHDVRMVWVANRIAGTEHFRFKGHHGRYLACDKIGLLSATSEAISPLETWSVVATPDAPGTFQLQTLRDTFLTAKAPGGGGSGGGSSSINTSASSKSKSTGRQQVEIRADADAIAFDTTVRIRMQACYKPQVRSSRDRGAQAKISRRELEDAAGRRLNEDEVRMLKRAKREGDFHERLLEIKVKSKHDKFG
ncbi:Protein frg1 [Escovopsis weberi]|uniref:Protein frg1 n=1 Tax=Escovopsis weberi TaxID=150374 RepID=A0A0M8N621_ESCWE|nr:Protein frg1 [Escovopsis weberi]